MSKISVIIQARSNSSRLKNKMTKRTEGIERLAFMADIPYDLRSLREKGCSLLSSPRKRGSRAFNKRSPFSRGKQVLKLKKEHKDGL